MNIILKNKFNKRSVQNYKTLLNQSKEDLNRKTSHVHELKD